MGLQLQCPVLVFGQELKVGLSLFLALPLSAVHTPAQNNWDQRNIPSGWAASQTIKTCWKCFWKCLHWKETRLTSSSKQCCEQSGDVHGLHVNQPRSDHCAEVSSFPVKSELLPNDEEALVERNRSKVKHRGENSLEKK